MEKSKDVLILHNVTWHNSYSLLIYIRQMEPINGIKLHSESLRDYLHGGPEGIRLFFTEVNGIICSHQYTLSVKQGKC